MSTLHHEDMLLDIFEEVQDYDTLEISINTAWSPPEGVIEKLREKFPELTFQCFYDEPGCEIAGYY